MKVWVLGMLGIVAAGCQDNGLRGPCLLGEPGCGQPLPHDATCCDSCNPAAQIGCNAGEKCTWILDLAEPRIQHIGCAPVGSIRIGEPCETPPPGPWGYDACTRGAVCHAGTCKEICDHDGGAAGCGRGRVCMGHPELVVSGTLLAGVCEPACEPLTQVGGDGAQACGATDPAAPDRGCYGYSSFTCAEASPEVLTRTDRTAPRTNSSGNPLLNGCAPGYLPFFFEATGSTTTLCSGLCAALPTDSTPAHVGNARGDPSALGKRPDEAAPQPGHATCAEDQRGSEPSSACRYLWPYVVDDLGMLPAAFDRLDLGVCMAIAHFAYDSDGDQLSDAPYPDCATLPPRSAATPGPHDDAYDWGCQPYDPQQPMLRGNDLRVVAPSRTTLARHALR